MCRCLGKFPAQKETTLELFHPQETIGIIFWALKLWDNIREHSVISICVTAAIIALIVFVLIRCGCILWDLRSFTYGQPENFYISEIGRIHQRLREVEKHIKYNIVIGGQDVYSIDETIRQLNHINQSRAIIELADISVEEPTGYKYVPQFEEPKKLSKRAREKLAPPDGDTATSV